MGSQQPSDDRRIELNRRTAIQGLTGTTVGALGLNRTVRADSSDCNFIIDGIYIQDAIDEAEAGATLCLDNVEQKAPPGGVVIDKELTLVPLEDGEQFTLDAAGRTRGISIEADNVTLRGVELFGDRETSTGVSIYTGSGGDDERATTGITLENNEISNVLGPGGPNDRFSWGILSFGQNPLSNVDITGNTIAGVGGPDSAGIGIGLEELEGDEPGAGAKIEENELGDIVGSDDPPFPGVGIAINPNEGNSSGAGPPGAKVEMNTIRSAELDVVVGDLRATEVVDGIF